MRYRVLGPLRVSAESGGTVTPRGPKQRLLLATLLVHAPRVVSVDRLIDVLWPHEPPASPASALQVHISRLRAFLGEVGSRDAIVTEPYGYRLALEPEDVDARRFEALVADARRESDPKSALAALDEAASLWAGDPLEEFVDNPGVLGEVARLKELRVAALERRVECLLALGRTDEALVECESLVSRDPLRERPCALIMEALYRSGRQADALDAYRRYRRVLSEELGLDPSPALRALELKILRHELPPTPEHRVFAPLPGAYPTSPLPLRIGFAERRAGGRIAYGELGAGRPMLVLPGWVSSLAAMRAGIDPRCAFLHALAERMRLVLYDRYGMGLSAGRLDRLSLETDADEIRDVMDAMGLEAASLLAASQAGPPALAFAARHPGRVRSIVLLGSYACGARTFPREDVRESMIALVRAHWGIGSKALADLIIPGASAEEAANFARVQRESATAEVAAAMLEHFFAVDVTDLLPSVRCPALVLHYTGDRAIPFRGGQELATLLPDARLVPVDGGSHLPRSEDLPELTKLIAEFVASGPAPADDAPPLSGRT